MLRRGRKGCYCRRQGGGGLTFSRSSSVVGTATRLTRSANRRASQRRRRNSGAMTYDHTDTDADEDEDKDNDTDT